MSLDTFQSHRNEEDFSLQAAWACNSDYTRNSSVNELIFKFINSIQKDRLKQSCGGNIFNMILFYAALGSPLSRSFSSNLYFPFVECISNTLGHILQRCKAEGGRWETVHLHWFGSEHIHEFSDCTLLSHFCMNSVTWTVTSFSVLFQC